MDSLRYPRRLSVLSLLAVASLTLLAATPAAVAYEGYGYPTVGGQGGTTYHVTNTKGDTSTGSLRWALSQPSPKIIVFDVGGTITLSASVEIRQSYITIDGTTAPSPGITIRPPSGGTDNALVIQGAHDIIIRGLRFKGFGADLSGGDLLALYGQLDGIQNAIYNVVVDHCTFEAADDGALDITEDAHDVTVSWCFFLNNNGPQLIKYGVRQRLSIHHNVYANSPDKGTRHPMVWGDLDNFDFVNNINYGWYWDGVSIRHEGDGGQPGKRVNANLVNNLFTHVQWSTITDALLYGASPGPDSEDGGPAGNPPQGTIVTTSDMGRLWVSGNILPPQNRDQYSTVSGPLAVPAAAQVTTWPASELTTRVLPTVGTVFRTSAEQTLLDEVAAADTTSALSVTGPSPVTEGSAGTVNAVFTVTLSPAASSTVTVNYATANGTATSGTDYVAASGTLTFTAGQTSKTISVAVNGDTQDEPDETFYLDLSNPTNATIATGQGTATIVDDDIPTVSMSINDVSVSEGNSGTANAVFTVTLSGTTAQTVTVNYTTANGTATAGSDYSAQSGNLTFAPGQTTKTITIAVNGDTTVEPNETFLVNLSSPVGATLADAQGQGTIANDDTAPAGELVVWTSLVGATASGGSLTKTAVTAWGNAGAISTQELPSGDGYVQFSASETTTSRMLGLSKGNTSSSYDDIDFALYLYLNEVRVYEGGIYKGSFGTYVTGDIMRVAVVGGVVRYSRNGAVLYSSAVAPTYPLLVDTALCHQNATLNSVVVAGFVATPTPTPTPAPNGVPVVWTSLVGVTANGGSLTKTAATAWGNAGAISTQELPSGDGYVEFSASETTTSRMLGLSKGNTSSSYDDIDFALYLYLNEVRVYEGGIYKGSFGTYVTGDIMRVAVVGGVVRYSRNGAVLYSSAVAPTYPLLVDTALCHQNATLNSVVVGFVAAPAPNGVPVVWTSLVGVTANGGSLTKTAATAWGNAGAISTQELPSGDGYVEFSASETTTSRMLGLSKGNTSSSYDDIDFALYLYLNEVRVYEGGIYKGSFGTYVTGDIMRVAVVGGVVRYSRNGAVLYSSAVAPTYPLLVDTALCHQNATLNSVVVGFVAAPAPNGVPVVWTSLVGVTANGGSLTKTAATAWGNAGAISTQELPSGDGYVEFAASETTTSRMLGLSKGNTSSSYDDIDFALYLYLNEVRVYEGGIYKGSFGTYVTGDIMRVAVVGGVVRYSRNGAVLYSSAVAPTYPLLVDTALCHQNATLNNVVVGFVAAPAPNGVPVVWTSLVGVTANGGSLTKTAATAWGNAGAISTQELPSGDGYVEFAASETTTSRMLGLSKGNTSSSYDDIDFALYLYLNEVRVYEGGIYKGSFGTYVTGDIMRVAVVGGVVRYSRNGAVLYSSAVAPTYPLLVDTALCHQNATLNNVVVGGLQ